MQQYLSWCQLIRNLEDHIKSPVGDEEFRTHMGIFYYSSGLRQHNLKDIECIVYKKSWIILPTLGELNVTLSEKLFGEFLNALGFFPEQRWNSDYYHWTSITHLITPCWLPLHNHFENSPFILHFTANLKICTLEYKTQYAFDIILRAFFQQT